MPRVEGDDEPEALQRVVVTCSVCGWDKAVFVPAHWARDPDDILPHRWTQNPRPVCSWCSAPKRFP